MSESVFPATAMPDRDWWHALWPDPDDIVRRVGIEGGMNIVDLCCGDGYFTARMAKLPNVTVYALDIDPEMLSAARREVARQGGHVAEWIHADACDLAARVAPEIDYVLMANTFHGVPDPTGLARSVIRVLRPTGRFGIVNWHPLPREQTTVLGKPRGPRTELRLSPDAVRAVVEPAGFQFDRLEQLPPYHYAAIFRKAAP